MVFNLKLWHKVTLALVLGVIFGILAGEKASYLKPIGDLFLNSLKMVIIPLIFFSLIVGITGINDTSSFGRIGIKAVMAYFLTTSFAIFIGLSLAIIFEPGVNVNLPITTDNQVQTSAAEKFSFVTMIVGIIPTNAMGAMVEGNLLQVVFFSIFTGFTLISLGEKGKELTELCRNMATLIFKMVEIIIKFSPYGAFALTSWIVGTQGVFVLKSLGSFIALVLFAMLIQYFMFGILIYLFAGISPWNFYKKSIEYQILALSTSSSKATLATTMNVSRQKLGISDQSTSFVLPLGAAMNMDGTSIYLGMSAVFFAQCYGVDLSMHHYFIIMITATIGSIGGAGIPGSSVIMMPMILSSVNVPIEGVALITGIDRILDMVRTTINITGDVTVTLIVDKSEGKLNEEIYNQDL